MAEPLVLLPGYNVARHLPALVAALGEHVPAWPLLLVDDGSADGTADAARQIGLDVVEHPHNRGKGAALATGFDAALERGAPAVLCMDSDGQHLPAEAPRFAEAWRGGLDVVVGNRMGDNATMPWLRKRTNEFTSRVISALAGCRIEDSQSGYRLLSAPVLERLVLECERYDAESEMLIKAGAMGFRIGSVPISTVYGDETSSIHPFTDTLRFTRLVSRAARWRREARATGKA